MSLGWNIKLNRLLTYINYLHKTFIISKLVNYSSSRNKAIYNPPKIYFEDTGIGNIYASKTNYGALVENTIYNHIKKQFADKLRLKLGYWYENKQEIDFVKFA